MLGGSSSPKLRTAKNTGTQKFSPESEIDAAPRHGFMGLKDCRLRRAIVPWDWRGTVRKSAEKPTAKARGVAFGVGREGGVLLSAPMKKGL